MLSLRKFPKSLFSRRNFSHGWLKKDMNVEENSGFRETQYKVFQFDSTRVKWLVLYLFVPAYIIYEGTKQQFQIMDRNAGKFHEYGIFPPIERMYAYLREKK